MSVFFEHIGPRERIQKVLNVLVEAPYFYRSDDPDLYAFLRKNRAEFERFYRELYDWQLVVDIHGARLYKKEWHNRAIRPSQRDIFDLTRRDDCIAFLLVLEFHEHLLDERNVSIDDPLPLRFQFGELFEFARTRFRETLGEQSPADDEVRKILRELMPTLLRFRLLAELQPERDDVVDRDHLLYECLPALYLYDVRALGEDAFAAALRMTERSGKDAEAEQ
jgi:hypothetical protein